MKIGIICNHLSFPAINYLITNNLIAGFAVPDMQSPGTQNIKLIAETYNLQFNILQKNSLFEDISFWLSDIGADVVFIFSFPYKIPGKILEIPRFGFINFHPSILPSYRGPDPLFWQIKNGITETGITVYKVDKDIDTGPIIHFEKEKIEPADTYGILSEKLADTLLRSVIKLIRDSSFDNLKYTKQDEKISSYFGKPKREDLIIKWEKQDALSIYNLVRASNPKYQGALSFYKNSPVRILQVSIHHGAGDLQKPGTILNDNSRLKVATIDNKIISIEVIYCVAGYYSGKTFKELFNAHYGERFGK